MTKEKQQGPDRQQLRSVYAFGIFSMALIDVFVFLIPIYAGITLGMSDGKIGALVGARSILSLLLSIHGGTLMDRFGTRRITLVFTGAIVICAPLFPLLSTFGALLVLQAISGFAISLGWSGAQTLIARVAYGNAEYIGRFSTFARIGTTVAPPITGFLFDVGGAWLAYSFGMLWAVAAFIALWRAPEPNKKIANNFKDQNDSLPEDPEQKFRLSDLLPRLSDYGASFALLAIPAVAFTAIAMLVRNSSYGIQTTVYVTYAEGAGLTATKIGLLFAAIELTSGIASWFAGRTMRRFDPIQTLSITTLITIVIITMTPMIGGLSTTAWGVFGLLLVAQITRGVTQGISQPILFSVQAISVKRNQQGSVVGIRQTMNRISGIIIPPLIGFISDAYGREESFYVVGGGLFLLCLGLAVYGRYVPRIENQESIE